MRAWARSLLGRSPARGSAQRFDFQDLVVLRAARNLIEAGVPAMRVRGALEALRRRLPEGASLAGVQIRAEAETVVVRDETGAWNAETGQRLLDFEPDPERDFRVAELADAARALDQGPDAAGERHFEEALALEESDPGAARDAYQRALRHDPALVEATVNLVRLLHEGGERSEAVRLARRSLERHPDEPLLHFNLAVSLEAVEGPEAALPCYLRAAELDPELAEAHWAAGLVCEKLDRRAEALRHYREFARLTDDTGSTST